jgi:cell division protein FtsB
MCKKFLSLIFFALILFSTPCTSVHAQAAAVIDVANLIQAIETLYATYDHITQAVETVKNTYQQLQKQIEMVKNMDWDDVGETFKNMDPASLEGILAMRGQIKDLTYYVNRNMNLINNVEDTLTRKTINFGGKNYTFGGLFGFGRGSPGTTVFDLPKNIQDYVEETADEVTAGYEGRLSYQQKEAVMRRYGLSPRNYAKVRLVEEQTSELVRKLLTAGTGEHAAALLEEAHENQKAVDDLMSAAGESMVGQQQAAAHALFTIATGLTRLEGGVNRFAAYAAGRDVAEDQKREIEARERELREMRKQNEKLKTVAPADWELY